MPNTSSTPTAQDPAADRMSLARRAGLLFVCIVAGLGIGFAGQALSGDAAWFLAVPACLLVGWLFVADPTQCVQPRSRPGPRN